MSTDQILNDLRNLNAGKTGGSNRTLSPAKRGGSRGLLNTSALGLALSLFVFKPPVAAAQEACGPEATNLTCATDTYGYVAYNAVQNDFNLTVAAGSILSDGLSITNANGVTGVDVTVNAANTTANRTTSSPDYLASGIRVGTWLGLGGADLAQAGTINITAGNVDVTADAGRGILAFGGNTSITANSVIARSTAAPATFAILADTSTTGGNISINVNNAETFANGGTTVLGYAGASNSVAPGSVTINAGTTTTHGNNASGITAVSGTGAVSVTSAQSSTSGSNSNAVGAFSGGGSMTINSTSAITTGDGSYGVFASGGGNVVINSGFVSTSGGSIPVPSLANPQFVKRSIGVLGIASTNLSIPNSSVLINSDHIEYTGGGAIAIYASALDGDITINSNEIVGNGTNVYSDPASGGNGRYYVPIAIATDSRNGAVTVNANSIINHGVIGSGIGVNNTKGPVSVNVGTIETFGAGAMGITSTGAEGNLTIVSNSITTHGDSIHLENVEGAYNNRSDFFADAIEATSRSGSVTVTSNDATVLGQGNQAITIIAANNTTLNSRNATNLGQGANAIGAVLSAGLMDINLTGATNAVNGTGVSLVALDTSNVDVDLSSTASILARDGGLLTVMGSGTGVFTNRGRIETTGTSLGSATGAALDINASAGAHVTVNNYGTIIGGLSNSGVVGAAITFSDGVLDETLNLFTGSRIVGSVDGQGGVDTLNLAGTLNAADASQAFGDIVNFEKINVNSGYWTQGGQTHVDNIDVNSGALILTGLASGNTNVKSGAILQVGGGGETGTLNGDILANGTVIFNRSNDYLFAGGFAGNGSLVKRGAGKLTLDGTYSFTGTTSIQAGSLKITQLAADGDLDLGAGGDLDLSGGEQTIGGLNGQQGSTVNIDQGTLTINQGTGGTSTFGGALTGNGSLVIGGGGSVNLTGVNTYTGPTTVNAGKLSINGSIASAVTVNDGSVLGGSGTINGSILIRRNAFLAPGNSPGVLTVGGPLTLSSGSTFVVEIDPRLTPVNDRIDASGVVTIQSGAKLSVDPQGPISLYNRANDYTIINAAGGLIGTFQNSDITSSMVLLDPLLVYEPNRLRLQLIRNDVRFNSIAVNANQVAVANATEAKGKGAAVYNALVAQNDAGLRAGFDALSGEIHGSASTILVQESSQYRNRLLQQLNGNTASGFWLEATGQQTTLNDNFVQGYAETTSDTAGYLGGAQFDLGGMTLGGSLAFTRSDIDAKARQSDVTAESIRGALYAGATRGALGISFGVEAAQTDLKTARAIVFPGVAQFATASYDAQEFQAFGEVGYNSSVGAFDLTPFARLAWSQTTTDGFTESSPLGLTVAEDSRDVLFSELGARVQAPADWKLRPKAELGWQHASGDQEGAYRASFGGAPGFRGMGATLDDDALLLSASLDYQIAPNASLSVGYAGQLASDTRQDLLSARFVSKF